MVHQILKNIKAIRKLKGLSQEDMAEELGITQSSYARLENQARKIDYVQVEQIASNIFDMTICQVSDFHKKDEYKANASSTMVAEERETYFTRERKLLEDKSGQQQQIIDMQRKQLADKDQIIDLLKQQLDNK